MQSHGCFTEQGIVQYLPTIDRTFMQEITKSHKRSKEAHFIAMLAAWERVIIAQCKLTHSPELEVCEKLLDNKPI